jgi:type VI protein secretion system component VasF
LTDAYQQSKENLQGIIDQGKEAMEEILQVAKAGQHPRAFEVYGTLLKNMVDANKELLAIQKQMREMDGKSKEVTNTTIDKAIFVGSTSELSKLLKGKT